MHISFDWDNREQAVRDADLRVAHCDVELISAYDRVVYHHKTDTDGFEPETRREWARLSLQAAGDGFAGTMIDVGAYTGLYAIAAKKLGACSIAVEPHPLNMERLRHNSAINHAEDIITFQLAASDHTGDKVQMHSVGTSPLPSGLHIAKKRGAVLICEVSTMRLDELTLPGVRFFDSRVVSPARVHGIKFDVERYELQALAGAAGIIADFRPEIIIECLDDDMTPEIMALLPNYDFRAKLDGRNMHMVPV